MIHCSIGVCVFNEERNIEKLLTSLKKQRLSTVYIDKIYIIVSGSTDNTYSIVQSIAQKSKKIEIIRERKRKGKASAVNLFLDKAISDILILAGGDLILERNTVQNLVSQFRYKNIGMVGAHPIPINKMHDGFASRIGIILWELHHYISLYHPKMGEVIAFRKIFKRIPTSASVDEANIEPLIRGQGYRLKYIPNAIVYNKAPTNLADFIKRRRKNHSGHLAVKYEQGYQVSTISGINILKGIRQYISHNRNVSAIFYLTCAIVLEIISRILGRFDYYRGYARNPIWDVAESTKDL